MEVRKIDIEELEVVYIFYNSGSEGTGYISFGRCWKDLFWGVDFNLSKGRDAEEDVKFILKEIKELMVRYRGRNEIFRDTNWKHYVHEFVKIGKLHAATRNSSCSTFNTGLSLPSPV